MQCMHMKPSRGVLAPASARATAHYMLPGRSARASPITRTSYRPSGCSRPTVDALAVQLRAGLGPRDDSGAIGEAPVAPAFCCCGGGS